MTARLPARGPLIDLHLHLEGSLSGRVLSRLARRHGIARPGLRFDGFEGFLRAFGAVCDLLRDPVDFEMAVLDVVAAARRLGVIHLEILFSPQIYLRRGIIMKNVVQGLLDGRSGAKGRSPMSVVFIADGVRQWGPEWFERMVRDLEPWAGEGVAAIGLGGDEAALPAARFRRAFEAARRMGLWRTIHAGEVGGPASVQAALSLGVDRIGHGIGAASDAGLMKQLARRGVPLELCPGSNVATGVVGSLREVPVRRLMEAGVGITINSDDGAFFRTNVATELTRAARAHALGPDECRAIVRRAARAAFLPRSRVDALVRRVSRG
ncbi:MAG: adenosine deaminase [Candidatus Polarisedimenticolia bacterium]